MVHALSPHVHLVQCTICIEPFTKLHCVHTGACIEHLNAVNICVHYVHWALYRGKYWVLFKTQHVHFVQCTIYIEPFTKFHRVHTGACIEHLKAVNIIVHCVHWALYKGMHWALYKTYSATRGGPDPKLNPCLESLGKSGCKEYCCWWW